MQSTPMTQTLVLTDFTPDHLAGALRLSQAVSWPHRTEDWAMLLELGRGVVALEGTRVIGTALGCAFGPSQSVANMIIVDAAYQGRGLGRRLMQAVLPSQGTCRLVATAEGLPLYHKLGFQETGRVLQYQGALTQCPAPKGPTRRAEAGDLDQIIALESASYGGDRAALVRWLAENAQLTVQEDSAGQITGLAASRPFGRGYVIGPVVAPDAEAAQNLIAAAAQGQEGQFLRVDTTDKAGLGPWLETLGLAHVGGGVTMQRGDAPPAGLRHALFSQALG
jgi:GNAT superfamily N-acetyltransferase